MSTPWISETIKELERQLKVTLFVRTTRSVQLTDAGRVFASLLSHVLDDLDDAVRVAQRMTARSGRPLTLGYVIGAGLELVPRLVRTYLERRPDQTLRSVEYDFADPTAGLRDHDVDAAIVRPPLGLASGSGSPRRGIWYVSAAHTEADVAETLDRAGRAFSAFR